MAVKLGDVSDWLFRDRASGRIVVAQMPNAAAWVALVAFAFRVIVPAGRARTVAGYVLVVALVAWAVDEIVRGVNPWRRILGVATLVAMVAWFLVPKH